MKTLKINDLYYEMLVDCAKAARKKPEAFIEETIKNLYQGKK